MARRPPDTVHVAITCADGTLAVMAFVTAEYRPDGSIAWSRPASADNVAREIDRAMACHPGKVPIVSWRPIDPADVPKDRTYRDALVDDGAVIGHDLEKVKAIALDRLRQARTVKFPDLDAAWLVATRAKDAAAVAAVEAQQQTLADAPAALAEALTRAKSIADVDALLAAVPLIGDRIPVSTKP